MGVNNVIILSYITDGLTLTYSKDGFQANAPGDERDCSQASETGLRVGFILCITRTSNEKKQSVRVTEVCRCGDCCDAWVIGFKDRL